MKTALQPIRVGAMAILVGAALGGLCTGRTQAATVGVPEKWAASNTAGWAINDLVNERVDTTSLALENGALKMTMRKQTVKTPPEEWVFQARTNASGGVFCGNYLTSGMTGLSFRIFCEYAAEVSVLLYNEETYRLWRYRIPDIRTGQWLTVEVPLGIRALQSVNGIEGAGGFEEDMAHVSWLGVDIERCSSMNSQVYRLDDVVLQGCPEFGAWMTQFGHPAAYGNGDCNSLPEGDLDGDSLSNFGEWVAGSSAGDAADCFHLEYGRSTEADGNSGLPVLRWKSASNRTYSVWRATHLAEGFTQIADGVDAVLPENVFTNTTAGGAAGNGPVSYRVGVTRPDVP